MNTLKQKMLNEASKSPNTFSSSKFSLLLDACVKKYKVKE